MGNVDRRKCSERALNSESEQLEENTKPVVHFATLYNCCVLPKLTLELRGVGNERVRNFESPQLTGSASERHFLSRWPSLLCRSRGYFAWIYLVCSRAKSGLQTVTGAVKRDWPENLSQKTRCHHRQHRGLFRAQVSLGKGRVHCVLFAFFVCKKTFLSSPFFFFFANLALLRRILGTSDCV